MKFDVAIGNPPYNRGMDIDFVFKAYDVTKDKGLICMITPAKWQAADDNQIIKSEHSYGDFRRVITPHIKQVVYHLEGSEIFEIRNIDGITHYIVDKSKTYENNCIVVNTIASQKYFNNTEVRDITKSQSLNNIGNELHEHLKKFPSFEFDRLDTGKRYQVYTGSQLNGGCGWGYADRANPSGTYDRNGMLHCIGLSVIRDTYSMDTEDNKRGAEQLTFASDNLEECKSFVSYLNSKLVRFMVLMNVSKLNSVMTNHYFRLAPYVPNGKYDHIFTDKEVYEYFNIPDRFIQIIEAVIKDRKDTH